VSQYRSRVSGPLLDRFDLQVEMQALPPEDLREGGGSERSALVAARVLDARRRRSSRQDPEISRAAMRLLRRAVARLGLSARAYDATLRVARTIATLEEAAEVGEPHIAEAIQYRGIDLRRDVGP